MDEKEKLVRTQNVALNILNQFDLICQKYKLKYFAIGGTCIGAVRHQGFIPWDDDIDVAMPIEDYYRFIEIAKKKLKNPLEILNPHYMKHYNGFYFKLQDSSTTFIGIDEKRYPDRYAGIYIDLFPVCGLPKNKLKRKLFIRKCSFYNKLNYKLRFPFKDNKDLFGKIIWLSLTPLRCVLPFYYASDKLHKLIRNMPFDASDKVLFPWRRIPGKNTGTYKNVFRRDDFIDTIKVKFEDSTIMIPIGYDSYLKRDFDDYMTLPPEEQRIPRHPKAIIDFERSYKYYYKNAIKDRK